MKRRSLPEEPSNVDRWIVSYADFITLLFAFFVVMYAISSVDARKFERISQGMKTAFVDGTRGAQPILSDLGLAEQGGAATSQIEATAMAPDTEAGSGSPLGLLRDRVESALGTVMDPEAREQTLRVTLDDRGLVLSLSAQEFFRPGRAKISRDMEPVVDSIGKVLSGIHTGIRVEGHTDDKPIRSGRYPSNWELSSQRATSVVRRLVEVSNVAPERLSAAGYASYRPLVRNDTDENRAVNRRVDIIILAPVEDTDDPAEIRQERELSAIIKRLPASLPDTR